MSAGFQEGISVARIRPRYESVLLIIVRWGRASEVLGLEAEDVSFDRRKVTFRDNRWRCLKMVTSHRSVPLWPQLEEILRPYVFDANGPPGRLLFSSQRTAARAQRKDMIRDVRKALDAIADRAGWKSGEIRTKIFRHTYARSATDNRPRGAPEFVHPQS